MRSARPGCPQPNPPQPGRNRLVHQTVSTGVERNVDAGKSLQIGISYTVVIRVVPRARRWYVRRSLELQRSKRTGVERQIELTAETLWNEVASRLKGALNETTYRTWFAEAEGLDLTDDAFSIAVPNDFTREWIEGHFVGLIKAAVRDATGVERRISLTISDLAAEPATKTAEPPKRAEGEL